MFETPIPTFLRYGISHTQYWELTLSEINDYLNTFTEQEKHKLQLDYLLARNIAVFVNIGLNGKDIPPIEKVYPLLYQPVQSFETAKQDAAYMKAMAYKDQFAQYAKRYNEWRKKKGANN